MTQIPVDDYISKIILLENRVGAQTIYKLIEPFFVVSRNPKGMQAVAKTIADFVGLGDFTFIVSISRLKENVGGHIELNNSQEVFVEISQDTADYGPAIAATLAHEIAHKYLHFHGISVGNGLAYSYENEVVTDITTIYLGLGKLVLNGCEQQIIQEEERANSTLKTTRSHKSGYLTRGQFSFLYLLVCAMRGIDRFQYERGLSEQSLSGLEEVRRIFGYYFDDRFRQPDIRRILVDDLNCPIVDVQTSLSVIDKNLHSLEDFYIANVRSFLLQSQKRIGQISHQMEIQLTENEVDPCLRYLNTIRFDKNISQFTKELKLLNSQASKITDDFLPIGKILRIIPDSSPYLHQSSLFTKVIQFLNMKRESMKFQFLKWRLFHGSNPDRQHQD
jgi:hypothetical protein